MVRWVTVAALALAVHPILAGEEIPRVCNDKEPRDVCEIMVQRNDAYNQVAIEKGKEQKMEQAEDALRLWWKEYSIGADMTAEYWRQYVEGLSKKHTSALVKLPNGKLAYPMAH